MRIRLASRHDAAALREIYRPAVEHNAISFEEEVPTVAELAARMERIQTSWPWLVAEDRARVVGFAYAQPFRERSAFRFSLECAVYVDAGAQRRGVGRALYAALLRLAQAQGARTLFAAITLPNPASVALHEALGFQRAGTWPNCGYKHASWWDVGLWAREAGSVATEPPCWRSISSFSSAELAECGIYVDSAAQRGLPHGVGPAMTPGTGPDVSQRGPTGLE